MSLILKTVPVRLYEKVKVQDYTEYGSEDGQLVVTQSGDGKFVRINCNSVPYVRFALADLEELLNLAKAHSLPTESDDDDDC